MGTPMGAPERTGRFGRGRRILLTGGGFLLVMASLAVESPTASAAATCTFNGQTSVVTGVTPGGTISVECAGLPKKLDVILVQTSPLATLVSSANQEDEADTEDLYSAKSSSTGTLSTTFPVPSPYTDTDPNGVCAPNQAQVNAGEVGCLLTVATISGVSYGSATLLYTGQPSPESPTLSLSPPSACPGAEVTVSDGAGPGNWWGNAGALTPLTAADISIGGMPATDSSASISAATYNYSPPSPLVPPMLSGTFTVPSGVGSGDQDVTVTEPNTTGLPGTVSASAPLTVLESCQSPQVISFTSTPPTDAMVGGPTYLVSASGGDSGNPVTFTVDASAQYVCGIAASIVTFIGAGTCTIDANQAGNADYAAAAPAQQSFSVAPPSRCAFTNPAKASARVGTAFTFVVLTDVCAPSPTITASGLPSWVTLTDYHDGYATLTATEPLPGKHRFTLVATNSAGTVTQKFVLTVKKAKH